jgi:hypothetical protein
VRADQTYKDPTHDSSTYFDAPINEGKKQTVELQSLLAAYKQRKIASALGVGRGAQAVSSTKEGAAAIAKLTSLGEEAEEAVSRLAEQKKSMGIETSHADFIDFIKQSPAHLNALHAALGAEDEVINELMRGLESSTARREGCIMAKHSDIEGADHELSIHATTGDALNVADTASDCCLQCAKAPGCLAAVFQASERACWLKTSDGPLIASGDDDSTVVTPLQTVTEVSDERREVVPTEVTVFVLSGRDHFEARCNIRKTWGAEHDIVFMVGKACTIPLEERKDEWTCERDIAIVPSEMRAASLSIEESMVDARIDREPDVVRLDMTDAYRSLALKVKLSYAWLLENRRDAKWFHKADDDQYVDVDGLTALAEKFDATKRKDEEEIVIGSLASSPHRVVLRKGTTNGDEFPKWTEDVENYEPEMWPPFPMGSAGHTVTRGAAQIVTGKTKCYEGEDVSIGVWLEGVARFVDSPKYRRDGYCSSGSVSIGHDMGLEDFKRCTEMLAA